MSAANPDGPFSGRDAIFNASRRSNPHVFDERDLYSLVVGAAVADLRGAGADHDIVIELSDRRRLIVPSGRTGAHLQYDAPDSSEWDVPIPLLVESVRDRGLGTYIKVLETVGQLFCIILLTQTGRHDEITRLLNGDPSGRTLLTLNDNNELLISSSGSGSWCLNLIPKTKEAFKAVFLIATSVSARGGEIFFRRLEAETKLKEAEAEKAVIEVERRIIAAQKDRAAALREQLKTAASVLQFHKTHVSPRAPDDPMTVLFEDGFRFLNSTHTRL